MKRLPLGSWLTLSPDLSRNAAVEISQGAYLQIVSAEERAHHWMKPAPQRFGKVEAASCRLSSGLSGGDAASTFTFCYVVMAQRGLRP
jgi:hypothetical protein